MRHWTMGRKVIFGFGLMAALMLVVGGASLNALLRLAANKDEVIEAHATVFADVARLSAESEGKVASVRAFLLLDDERFLGQIEEADRAIAGHLASIEGTVDTEAGDALLDRVKLALGHHDEMVREVLALAADRTDGGTTATIQLLRERVISAQDVLLVDLKALVEHKRKQVAAAQARSKETVEQTTWLIGTLLAAALGVGGVVSVLLTRGLTRQLGAAIQATQSSSAELQAAAGQQASGAREQVSSMTEISTTIRELLATSQQIAESAQRVSAIAGENRTTAADGQQRMTDAQHTIDSVRDQVDHIVEHMLELGRKSQQIGGILEVINELAEQTNILAINATIEAVGAGESGARFGVVADEIRKLADRVGEAAKEIRTLIDEVRSAVNTTVMATESGSKAVAENRRQFQELRDSLARIIDGVGTTTEAALEIELSTKQQATGVEQVNVGVGNVAEASRESEASAKQILETAGQLSDMARELSRIIDNRQVAAG